MKLFVTATNGLPIKQVFKALMVYLGNPEPAHLKNEVITPSKTVQSSHNRSLPYSQPARWSNIAVRTGRTTSLM